MYPRLLCLCALFSSLASADAIYAVTVNTSSLSGTAGLLDFQFNPGPIVSQSAFVQILNFAGNGTLTGAPTLSGDAGGGPLPTILTFDNGGAFNDYFQGFTFGTNLFFNVRLYGPAINAPDGVSTSGSKFAFSMFSDPAGTIPALTTNTTDGFALTVDVNLDGTTTLTDFSTSTSVGAVPEPGSLVPMGIALASWLAWRSRGRGAAPSKSAGATGR